MKKESWSPDSKIVGMVPARDEERISLMKSTLHFTDEKARGLLTKMKTSEEKAKKLYGRPTWDDFFSVESREEKIAILDKMFGGSLTPEEVESFLEIE